MKWNAPDGGTVTVAEGSTNLTEAGDSVVLREETARTDTRVRLVIVVVMPNGVPTVVATDEVTL